MTSPALLLTLLLALQPPADQPAAAPPAPAGPSGPAAPTIRPTPEQRLAFWREDLAFLVAELPKKHKNAFFKCKQEDFIAAASLLDRDLPTLQDSQIVVRLMQLTAMLGDFHSGLSTNALGRNPHFFPISFAIFSDGPVIGGARESQKDLIGCTIVKFGQTPIDEALHKAATVVGYENDATFKTMAPRVLVTGEIAQGVGLIPAVDKAQIVVRDAAGTERTVELTAMTPGEKLTMNEAEGSKLPLYRQKRATSNWYEMLPDQHALYFHYERCADEPGMRIVGLTNDMLTAIDTFAVQRVVIDLRANGGGNSAFLSPFIQGLKSREATNRPGGVVVLVGRGTFSSAHMNAIKPKTDVQATFIGEPTGQKPNAYGEVKTFKLPHTQIEVRYSTKFWKTEEGDRPSTEPDVHVEPSWADYAAGKDPVLEAALSYQPK